LERDFDLSSFHECRVCEEKDAARAQILREAHAFQRGVALAKGKREKVGKSLSDTALNSNWKSSHGGVTSSFRIAAKAYGLL
jgi:hypothetical protein